MIMDSFEDILQRIILFFEVLPILYWLKNALTN